MAHRIYIYNIDLPTGSSFPHYLGEWNYEIPPLLLPLFSSNIRSKGEILYADKVQGVSNLRRFYDLLAEVYQLTYKKVFNEPVDVMFDFLENLPYDTFQIDGTDVFNMNEEKHSQQAKDWGIQIKKQVDIIEKAIDERSLKPLDEYLKTFGYISFLEALQTDWINYGLGYWNDDAYKNDHIEIFTENGFEGVRDMKNNIIVQPIYQEIYAFENNIAVAKKEDKYGYINSKGFEITPTQFDDAFDALQIFYGDIKDNDYEFHTLVGVVEQDDKYGLLDLISNTILIPITYEDLEYLYGNCFNELQNGLYYLVDHENELVVHEGSENKFEFCNYRLFFTKIKCSSKRKYFSSNGTFLGEYIEDMVEDLPYEHYYIRPNKFQKKIQIIKPDGSLLDTEIDNIIPLDKYETLAYKKIGEWFIYNLKEQNHVTISSKITNIIVDYFSDEFPNSYILQTDAGTGFFDAKQQIWLIPVDKEIQKITMVYSRIFSIQRKSGFTYWDGNTNTTSEIYDYISEAIDTESHKILLYKNDTIYALSLDDKLVEIPKEEMGRLYQNRYNLRGKDNQFFNAFYEKWKAKLGEDYFQYYDNDSLYDMAKEYIKHEKLDQAVPILRLGVRRGDERMMYDLAGIYSDENNSEFFNLTEAIELYTKSSELGHAFAANDLGYHLQNGIGCAQDIHKAIEYYEKAAQQGNGLALSNLGDLYFHGECVEQDYDKALDYYLKAQKKFYFNNQKITEIYYQKGEFNKVIPLLKKDIDEEFSPIYYGIMYENGFCLKENVNKAIKYYEKALEIAMYEHAIQRLLFHYRKDSPFANEIRFQELLALAKENDIEINREELGLEPVKKDSFLKRFFK
ncbi:SEL1-like repeat protein [Sphingobacterium bovistauri]|uniref:SEL1-like repeat protein n=1 Tax=Sphingobacterium bovistauri TaxID=2781959 RepID=A0ABS7Z4I7_9SPHI|nr:SEL1-like repeat protein [Sphingobacterium bovistauri]MCA5005083.1 SEL1-like repeat protein [Sphingobacterium bovistauri]